MQQIPLVRDWFKKADNLLDIVEVGSTMVFGHCEHEEDIFNYQGIEFDFIAVEEVTQFTEFQWQQLAAHSNRTSVPGLKPVMWATGNPGGIGHQWVKRLWVDRAFRKNERPERYVYIPARVWDNKTLIDNDPDYIQTLQSIDDPELRRAYLDGDWDIYPDQYFTQFRRDLVVIPSFHVPDTWPLYGALDYGESAPCSFGLYTIDYDGVVYRISEYYQADRAASQHADAIRAMIRGCPHITSGRFPSLIYASHDMWTRRRLDEHSTQTVADKFLQADLPITRANNDRINGWRICRDALVHNKFKLFDGWGDQWLRTVPGLPRDSDNVEEVDGDAEDHAAEEWRYAMVHLYKPHRLSVGEQTGPFNGSSIITDLENLSIGHHKSVYAGGKATKLWRGYTPTVN